MKKLLLLGVACGLIVLGSFVSARAADIDILVDKLVKKGILNKQEATEVSAGSQRSQLEGKRSGARRGHKRHKRCYKER